jgi:hypothetical protein
VTDRVAALIPLGQELIDDAAWFRGAFDVMLQRGFYAWTFGESTTPVMSAIEGLPSRWDSPVWVEETIDYMFGGASVTG